MDPDKTQGLDGEGLAPSKVVINGVEYEPEEAQSLIGLGQKAREYEQKWNSPIDSLATAYGKSQSELKAEQSQRAELQSKIEAYEKKQEAGTDTGADLAQAKEAARKLGLILNEDLEKSGYIKKDDLPQYLQSFYKEQKAIEGILSTADRLEKEISGEDGRPRFNKKVVLAYAQAYNKSDLKEAYEEMHADSLKAWKDAQVEAKKGQPLKTLSPGGQKEPKVTRVTDDNMKERLREKLFPGQK